MKLLITGGTGFIGTHLVSNLFHKGYDIALLCRDSSKARQRFGDHITCLELDLRRPPPLAAVSVGEHIHAIVHLAACLRLHGSRNALHELNVNSSLYLLRLAARNGIKRFVFASSIEAMGPVTRKNLPAPETLRCAPVSNYGLSKLRAERELTRLARDLGVPLTILRIANVYNHTQGSFPQILARGLASGGPLVRYYPAFRDLIVHPIHVLDCVKAIENACDSRAEGIFNIAGPRYCTIAEIASLLCQREGTRLPSGKAHWWVRNQARLRAFRHRWQGKGDLLTYWMSGHWPRIHRGYSTLSAKTAIGFQPQIDVEQGITFLST